MKIINFKHNGNIRVGVLDGDTVIDRAEEARAGYIRKLNSHRDGLRALATTIGWSFSLHHTDHSPQPALAALHNAMTGHRR